MKYERRGYEQKSAADAKAQALAEVADLLANAYLNDGGISEFVCYQLLRISEIVQWLVSNQKVTP